MGKKIMIVTDAWSPQINGVVTTLTALKKELEKMGHSICMVTPNQFDSFPLWFYPEIKIAYKTREHFASLVESENPDYIHIATEGTLGLTARQYCTKNKLLFLTAYHTRFPEYLEDKLGIPPEVTYFYMRWFHSASKRVLVPNESLQQELSEWGIPNSTLWSRGVDSTLFSPDRKIPVKKPYLLYVGRISSEKNLEAFLELDFPEYDKVVVGTGTEEKQYMKRYPDVIWRGAMSGVHLAQVYASAECFVFPSLTDTFGLVMIESLASGVPVAAYNTPQNRRILHPDVSGLKDDLREAIEEAIANRNSERCRDWVVNNYSWKTVAEWFMHNLIDKPTIK